MFFPSFSSFHNFFNLLPPEPLHMSHFYRFHFHCLRTPLDTLTHTLQSSLTQTHYISEKHPFAFGFVLFFIECRCLEALNYSFTLEENSVWAQCPSWSRLCQGQAWIMVLGKASANIYSLGPNSQRSQFIILYRWQRSFFSSIRNPVSFVLCHFSPRSHPHQGVIPWLWRPVYPTPSSYEVFAS